MTTYFMIFLTIVTVFVVAAGLIKVGKVPKMPAFYRNMIREGVFNRLIFKNYFFRKVLEHAKSNKMGKKDIMKIECPIDVIDLDILGFIDHNITINIIQDEKIVEKKRLKLPKEITNVIKCKNPRCITSIEQELDHVFVLTDPENEVYRCKYCEEKYSR